MTDLLLDTQAWFWLVTGDPKFPADFVDTVESASRRGALYVSAISPWEIALKESMGKIVVTRELHRWMEDALDGIHLVDIHPTIAIEATRLPGEFHKDPADRFVVATARIRDLTLVTSDAAIVRYGQSGHVRLRAI